MKTKLDPTFYCTKSGPCPFKRYCIAAGIMCFHLKMEAQTA